jgi:glycosyltransferase involved in cell wall biosynthesis
MDTLYIVVPCYNEEAVLPETSKRLREKLLALMQAGQISKESRILFVDDGSKDRTWELISQLYQADLLFEGVALSRNKGHQNALMAGLTTAAQYADMVISMDADLQDDINAVDEMVQKYHDGCEIVYGVRSSRATDTAFKRNTAQGYYKLINQMGGELVYDHADYRLMSRRALEALFQYGESNLFLRGIVPKLGFKTGIVQYARGERFAGESKYPLKKMLQFSVDGITSLTSKPIDYVFFGGCGLAAISVLLCILFLILGITSTQFICCTVLFCCGLNLIALGVVGQYVGKTYIEVKHRPRYHIRDILHH